MSMDILFRILCELVVLFAAGILGFFVAWQLRQDRELLKIRKEITEYAKTADYLKRTVEHNVPDAWKEADKSKDLLVKTLTELVVRTCGEKK